ncbi:MAG: hypothetical protein IJ680_09525 [Paludibacteraceae bacterium]|nr:hypothetical protein [Paludibacteraceae bacterium]
MSILFPKINKPREWDYRPIYYDPKQEEMRERRETLHRQQSQAAESSSPSGHVSLLQAADAGPKQEQRTPQTTADQTAYKPSLHRGSFREAANLQNMRQAGTRQSQKRLVIIVALLLAALLVFYIANTIAVQ